MNFCIFWHYICFIWEFHYLIDAVGAVSAKCNQFGVCWKIASYICDNAIEIISRQYGFLPAEISYCHI